MQSGREVLSWRSDLRILVTHFYHSLKLLFWVQGYIFSTLEYLSREMLVMVTYSWFGQEKDKIETLPITSNE